MAGRDSVHRIGERYEVVRELGRGSSATVYSVWDPATGRQVALKLLNAELTEGAAGQRFLREIRLLTRLEHPGIVPVLDVGQDGPRPFFTMPVVDGWTLRKRMAEEGALPVKDVVELARQLCAALAFAHGCGVLHRDIKPENVLGAGDRAYLADFGIARALDAVADRRVTSSGIALGTPAYMSPEQVSADPSVDARSDQYGLALVLYEALAGAPAFRGVNTQMTAMLRLTSDPVPLSVMRPGLPGQLRAALERALRRDPARRFPDIGAFAGAFCGASDRPVS